MANIVVPSNNLVSVNGGTFATSSAHTVTLGPFSVSSSRMKGLWLIYLDIIFGVPSTAVNEDVFLQDILGNTVMTFHCNLGIAPMPPTQVERMFTLPGLVVGSLSAGQQSWNLVFPATTSGPSASANMAGYLV